MPRPFDLQAHRGGAGLAPENTLRAFGNALDLGVSTLECDVHVSADGVAMVSHDRVLTERACTGPHLGRLISTVTRAELAEMDCGGEPMPTFAQVLALLAARDADEVGINVETKFDVLHPDETGPRERFVDTVLAATRAAGMTQRLSVQSFDWTLLTLVREEEPDIPLHVLTNTAYLEAHLPGASPWMNGVDIDDHTGSVAAAVAYAGFDAISPSITILTPAMVREAHDAGLRVLPYTVDEPADMRRLLSLEVDGMITNRPDLLRAELAKTGLPLPARHPLDSLQE